MSEYSPHNQGNITVLAYEDIAVGDLLQLVDQDALGTVYAIPIVDVAPADSGTEPFSTYVGVAMGAAASGEQLQMRTWNRGTLSATVEGTSTDREAGANYYWDGAKFVYSSTSNWTAKCLQPVTLEDNLSQVEFLVYKGGAR